MSAWDPEPRPRKPVPETRAAQIVRIADTLALRALLASDRLRPDERAAFAGMADDVARRHRPLSGPQAAWLQRVCERVGVAYGGGSASSDVPEVLRVLPKSPLGRRA